VAFGCTEFLATRERLDSLRIPYRVADVPLTGVRQVFLEDPAGNGVELNFDARAEG
jgi:glyoxylase I family protein